MSDVSSVPPIDVGHPPPSSTQDEPDNRVDSGIAMTGQFGDLGEHGPLSADKTKPDLRDDEPSERSPVDTPPVPVEGATTGTIGLQGTTEKRQDSSPADISSFVRSLEKILKSSSTHITFRIQNDSETENDDDVNSVSDPDSEDSKSLGLQSTNGEPDIRKEHEAGSCRCTACVNDKKHPEKRIAHAVEFTDDEGFNLKTEDREKPLDLNTERKKVNTQRLSTIFTVATVVKTSIPSAWKMYPIIDHMIKNPLINKDIAVNFQTLRLTITSPAVIQALRSVILYYPDFSLGSDRLRITSPFSAITHHEEDLREYRDKLMAAKAQDYGEDLVVAQKPNFPPDHQSTPTLCDPKVVEHITVLLDWVKERHGGRVDAEITRNERGLCTFSMLWLMLKPGITVYVRDKADEMPSAMVIQSVKVDDAIMFRNDNERSPYKLVLWYLDYDGRRVGRCTEERDLIQFDGERPIISLEVFPCHFLDKLDNNSTRNKMVERGKRWYSLLRGKMVMYDGQFVGDRLAKPVSTDRLLSQPLSQRNELNQVAF